MSDECPLADLDVPYIIDWLMDEIMDMGIGNFTLISNSSDCVTFDVELDWAMWTTLDVNRERIEQELLMELI